MKEHAALSPGYWMYETSGVLRPAVYAYLLDDPLTPEQVAAIRAYLRQWIAAPAWAGPEVQALRAGIDGLQGRREITAWLARAMEAGIDPL